MTRLTKWENGNAVLDGYDYEEMKYAFYKDNDLVDYAHLEFALKKLADYEDAEEQGLLLRLPCKEGDIVYAIEGKELFTLKATKNVYFIQGKLHIECESCRFVGAYCYEDLGTKLFLTPKEAGQKLAEMRKK